MNRIVLRHATVEEWPAILSLHREQQKKQGTNFDLPYLFKPPVILALVGVDQDDRIRNVIYAEAIAEMRFVGCDPKATAFERREIEGFAYYLKNFGYRCLNCFVPIKLKRTIRKPLERAGFTCIDREQSCFERDLR